MNKSLRLFLFVILGGMLFLSSCGDIEDDAKDSHVIINGTTYTLNGGVIENHGTILDSEIPYRIYYIELYSSSQQPQSYFNFSIYSPDTERLDEGEYTYAYLPVAQEFTLPEIGVAVEYDNSGDAIKGTILSESYLNFDFNNILKVSMSDGNKVFEATMQFERGGETYDVEVYYNGSLEAGYGM